MPSHDVFAEMLVWVPLNPLQSNRVSKNLLLNPFKLSLAQVGPSRLGGVHTSHSAGRSEEVVISTRRSRTGWAGGVDLNQQLLPSPQLQAEEDASHCPALHTHTQARWAARLAGRTWEATAVQLFSHIPLPVVTTVEKPCAEQLLPRMHSRLKPLQAPHALLFERLSLVKSWYRQRSKLWSN